MRSLKLTLSAHPMSYLPVFQLCWRSQACQHPLGDILDELFNPLVHVMCNHMSVQHDCQGLKITTFHIPCTKASSPYDKNINWAKQDGPGDLHEAILNHFHVNKPPANSHIFAYRAKNGHHPLTHLKFLQILNHTAKSAGIPPLKGHGIHIESTLKYLLFSISFNVVKVKGPGHVMPSSLIFEHMHRS